MTNAPRDAHAPSLWDWAKERYARAGVAELCLRLQDDHGLDVDIVLACLWRAELGQTVSADLLCSMHAAAAPIRARIVELRAVRRALGAERDRDPSWQPVYEHTKAAELAAERLELAALERVIVAAPPTPTEDADDDTHHPRALAAVQRYAEAHATASVPRALLEALVSATAPRTPSDRARHR